MVIPNDSVIFFALSNGQIVKLNMNDNSKAQVCVGSHKGG